ncbi:hypothetical protein LTR56_016017 [Elasticomyces elasticus]|nr:hypothetical protein LTR56_016017 [Elasticomyces elasticus]KAK3642463.1 hypothetical protein LTR22_016097 [Elasticomyces elasticus]KAK4926946.1 hypothetical protein LTR49_006103 [Elasticomyces elasticus]KAK5764274.1 hypothetical protein LTS12_005487 [Elasticomyces elasticus]
MGHRRVDLATSLGCDTSECSGSVSYRPPAISKPRQITPEAPNRQLIPVIYTSEQSTHERLASLKLENEQMRQTRATLRRQNAHLLDKGRGLARRASDRISKLKEKNKRFKEDKKALRLLNKSHERDLERIALLCSGHDTLEDDHRRLYADYLATSRNEESLKVEREWYAAKLAEATRYAQLVYFEGAPPGQYHLTSPDGTPDEHTLDEHMEWKGGELDRVALGGWLVQLNEEIVGAAGARGAHELEIDLKHMGDNGFGTNQWGFDTMETQEQQAKKANE